MAAATKRPNSRTDAARRHSLDRFVGSGVQVCLLHSLKFQAAKPAVRSSMPGTMIARRCHRWLCTMAPPVKRPYMNAAASAWPSMPGGGAKYVARKNSRRERRLQIRSRPPTSLCLGSVLIVIPCQSIDTLAVRFRIPVVAQSNDRTERCGRPRALDLPRDMARPHSL